MPKHNSQVAVAPMSTSTPAVSWKASSFFEIRRRQQADGARVRHTGFFMDLRALGLYDLGTIRLFRAAEKAGHYDDSSLLLERLIQLMYKLPRHSQKGKILMDSFVSKLWFTLDHPASPIPVLAGAEHRYRAADASNNNPWLGKLGAAGSPYAQAVPPKYPRNPNLPDAGLVFDTLLARKNGFQAHQCGISSMLFYLGTIITHDIFQTVR